VPKENFVDCKRLTWDLLSQHLKGTLPKPLVEQIQNHLRHCPICQSNWSKIQPAQTSSKDAVNASRESPISASYEESESISQAYLEQQEDLGEQIRKQLKKAPWWFLSLALNGILLLLTTMIMIGKAKEEGPENIIQAELPPKSEPEYEPEKKRDVVEEKKEIPKTDPKIIEKSEVQVPENVEVSDHMEADTQSDHEEMAEADLDNKLLADKAGDIGNFTGIGAGGGSGGAFGQRGRGGRKWLVKRGGGSKRTESAMLAGLRWLKRHQTLLPKKDPQGNEMGMWFSNFWDQECAENGGAYSEKIKFPGKCTHNHYIGGGSTYKQKMYFDHAISGLGLLAFAGAGYHHKRGQFKKVVRNALMFMVNSVELNKASADYGKMKFSEQDVLLRKALEKHPQVKTGAFSTTLLAQNRPGYQHSIVALGLCEVYGLSRDSYLKETCVALIRRLLKHQSSTGWRYEYASAEGDISVSTWAVMAIKAAKVTGILKTAAIAENKEEKKVIKDLKNMIDRMRDGNVYKYLLSKNFSGENRYMAKPMLGMASMAFLFRGKEMTDRMKPTVQWVGSRLMDRTKSFANFMSASHRHPGTGQTAVPNNHWIRPPLKKNKITLETLSGKKEIDLLTFQNRPQYTGRDYYRQYYATLALFQYGGSNWKVWNHLNSRWIVAHQFQGKRRCADGAWEVGTSQNAEVGLPASVPFATSLCVLQLQVYYRYKRRSKK